MISYEKMNKELIEKDLLRLNKDFKALNIVFKKFILKTAYRGCIFKWIKLRIHRKKLP